jgi:Skp family chaperone for outer membrane proteins
MKRSVLALLLFLWCAAHGQENVRIAVVDLDSVMAHMPEMGNALKQLDTATARFQQEMQALLTGLSHALYPQPGDPKKTDEQYRHDVDSLQKKLGAFQKYSREELERRRKILYDEIRAKARKMTVKFARKNGFKVVLEKKGWERALLYNELGSVEITGRILDQLKNSPEK